MADILFRTSGSTGEAKAILRTHESLLADARALARFFADIWGSRPFVVSTAPKDHLFGYLWRVMTPEVAGSNAFGETILSVEELDSACAGRTNVLFATTPSFLEKALAHPLFSTLRGRIAAVVTSGGPLRRATALTVKDVFGVCPIEIFGSTEAGTVAWRRQDEGEEWNVFDGVALSLDALGEIVIDSPYALERPLTMPDLARIVAPGRFLHLGRADRQVKILEEYVSLGAVEKAFEGHPLVLRARAEAYGEDIKRVGMLLVAADAGLTALADGTFEEVLRRLRGDLLSVVGPLAFPRRIRFVRALPVDERGKTKVADVAALLAEWCQEPVVLEWRETARELSATLVFPPDMECFRGHFPDHPILPGVAQLFFIRRFARQVFRDYPDAGVWKRLKFHKVIIPGMKVALHVQRVDEGSFDFSIEAGDGPYATGRLEGGR